MSHLSISAIARRYGIPPRRISDLFYARKLDDRICPIVDGRRSIPIEYLPTVENVLRETGVLKQDKAASDDTQRR